MATLVTFHAHPDDEAISCGGTMARAAAEGHRVVLVVATRGEHGEVEDGVLAPGEALADRRTAETLAAARVLGVDRVEFLGYRDSGMMGTPENEAPDCFWRAGVDDAAARLAAILDDERADALTVYDDHGVYGHPDHIQVHRVGVRAAELAGTPAVFEATMSRDHLTEVMAAAAEAMDTVDVDEAAADVDLATFGTPAHLITTTVEVTAFLDQKRKAMAAHASQISESSFFLNLDEDAFRSMWGREWFVRRGAPAGTREDWLLDAPPPRG
jgi:LmbE family N-acetylglucosaminyl deacetylase